MIRLLVLRLTVLAVMLLTGNPGFASFRCGTALVDKGDWPVEVQERCGDPDYVVVYPAQVLPGFGVTTTIEHWYYNPGAQGLITRLEFRNGILHREDSLGYGFQAPRDLGCSSGFLREGLSEYELLSRCGTPLSERVYWRSFSRDDRGYPSEAIAVMPIKEWLYELGPNHFRRVVVLHNGFVVDIRTDDKPH